MSKAEMIDNINGAKRLIEDTKADDLFELAEAISLLGNCYYVEESTSPRIMSGELTLTRNPLDDSIVFYFKKNKYEAVLDIATVLFNVYKTYDEAINFMQYYETE